LQITLDYIIIGRNLILDRPQIASSVCQDVWLGRPKQNRSLIPSVIYMRSTLDLPPKLVDYLNESRAPLPPVTDPDQPLQIDSLGLIRLVAFLESDLNVRVEDDELLADNFATGRNLAKLINPKMERLSAGGVTSAASSGQSELGSGNGSNEK
jgi:acyl carrier protein